MSSIRKNTSKSRRYLNLSFALALVIPLSLNTSHAQQLRQGVTVQMAHTTSAVAYPAADNNDAWIVAVTADGSLYFGVKPVSPDQLLEEMKATPRQRDAKLYVKADARAPFANVERVLEAGREVAFEAPVLLTAQSLPSAFGAVAPPNGLEVLIGPALPAGGVATVVQLLNSGQQKPLLSVNGDEISWSALEGTLRRHFQKGDEKIVLLKADERLPFAQVVQVIDMCRATGAKVVVDTSGL
jgi:biopolymer transport protein ExbD